MSNYEWLEKTTPRSVKQLRPWPENPRLDPAKEHMVIKDYVEDLITDHGEESSFMKLMKNIAEKGFIHVAPVVVWQNKETEKYYVAEGNRRILAVKLLLKPTLAPTKIRKRVTTLSQQANLEALKKIRVSIAPSLEEAEWFISERNSSASTIRPWSREQQQRWIMQLYEKHDGDISKILESSNQTAGTINNILRILKVRDYVYEKQVKELLTSDEYSIATSHRFPMTILERLLSNPYFREYCGIEFEGVDVYITSNKESFLNFYAELIRKIVNEDINTRFTVDDIPKILEDLPQVSFEKSTDSNESSTTSDQTSNSTPTQNEPTSDNSTEQENEDNEEEDERQRLKNDIYRKRLIPYFYQLKTDHAKLRDIFNELKQVPHTRYPVGVSIAIRTFLDLSILSYILKNNLEEELSGRNNNRSLKSLTLSIRIKFLIQQSLTGKPKDVAEKLLVFKNDFSLNTLNNYVHSLETHHIDVSFLNRFWDFLFPLLCELVEIEEID